VVVEIGLVGTTTKTLIKVTLLVAHYFSAIPLVKEAVLLNAYPATTVGPLVA
jgi:hypothetical protein